MIDKKSYWDTNSLNKVKNQKWTFYGARSRAEFFHYDTFSKISPNLFFFFSRYTYLFEYRIILLKYPKNHARKILTYLRKMAEMPINVFIEIIKKGEKIWLRIPVEVSFPSFYTVSTHYAKDKTYIKDLSYIHRWEKPTSPANKLFIRPTSRVRWKGNELNGTVILVWLEIQSGSGVLKAVNEYINPFSGASANPASDHVLLVAGV